VKLHYKDFADYQNNVIKQGGYQPYEKFWTEYLRQGIPLLDMPLDYKRGDTRTFAGDCIRFSIPDELTKGLYSLVRKNNITLNSLLISLYSILLSRYCNQEEVMTGSLVAGRNHPDLENVIGMFNNFVLIRIKAPASSLLVIS